MKEILKYLRLTNSYTQEELSKKLEISRQSYIKYENGEISPNDKIIRKLSIIYDVKEDFIRKNQIPKSDSLNKEGYSIDKEFGQLNIEEPVLLSVKDSVEKKEFYEGYFDGNCIRILNLPENINLKEGQRFKLYPENEEEEMQRRQKAFDKFMELAQKGKTCNLAPDKDPYYKEALYEALEEKYGPFD